MRRLWLADVHANLPAFEAVLADARAVDEVVFVGDIVGCGPHPTACIDLLRRLDVKAIAGNHDASVLAIRDRAARRANPVDWNEWTFDQLNESQRSYLAALPSELAVSFCGVNATVMHHPAGAPYLHPDMPDAVLAEHLHAVPGPVAICGHSHRQIDRTVGGLGREIGRTLHGLRRHTDRIVDGFLRQTDRNADGLRYVCIPPVGQPRNGDTRAGYAVESDGSLEFRFVPYDVEGVVIDIERIGLADEFCQRWVRFLRAGSDIEWSREYKQGQG